MTDIEDILGRAFLLANRHHAGQVRKGTTTPYISHLMAVSALVLEYGGTVEQAAAALLHDVVEDTGCTFKEIVEKVGLDVAQIVEACTHREFSDILDREERTLAKKRFYLERLLFVDRLASANLVALCDKVHNSECILRDWYNSDRNVAMFDKFNGGYHIQRHWYISLADAFDKLDVPCDLRTRLRTAASAVFGDSSENSI